MEYIAIVLAFIAIIYTAVKDGPTTVVTRVEETVKTQIEIDKGVAEEILYEVLQSLNTSHSAYSHSSPSKTLLMRRNLLTFIREQVKASHYGWMETDISREITKILARHSVTSEGFIDEVIHRIQKKQLKS